METGELANYHVLDTRAHIFAHRGFIYVYMHIQTCRHIHTNYKAQSNVTFYLEYRNPFSEVCWIPSNNNKPFFSVVLTLYNSVGVQKSSRVWSPPFVFSKSHVCLLRAVPGDNNPHRHHSTHEWVSVGDDAVGDGSILPAWSAAGPATSSLWLWHNHWRMAFYYCL